MYRLFMLNTTLVLAFDVFTRILYGIIFFFFIIAGVRSIYRSLCGKYTITSCSIQRFVFALQRRFFRNRAALEVLKAVGEGARPDAVAQAP